VFFVLKLFLTRAPFDHCFCDFYPTHRVSVHFSPEISFTLVLQDDFDCNFFPDSLLSFFFRWRGCRCGCLFFLLFFLSPSSIPHSSSSSYPLISIPPLCPFLPSLHLFPHSCPPPALSLRPFAFFHAVFWVSDQNRDFGPRVTTPFSPPYCPSRSR